MIKNRYLVMAPFSMNFMLPVPEASVPARVTTRIIFPKEVLRQKLSSQKGIISQKRAVSQMLMTSRQIFMLSHR